MFFLLMIKVEMLPSPGMASSNNFLSCLFIRWRGHGESSLGRRHIAWDEIRRLLALTCSNGTPSYLPNVVIFTTAAYRKRWNRLATTKPSALKGVLSRWKNAAQTTGRFHHMHALQPLWDWENGDVCYPQNWRILIYAMALNAECAFPHFFFFFRADTSIHLILHLPL